MSGFLQSACVFIIGKKERTLQSAGKHLSYMNAGVLGSVCSGLPQKEPEPEGYSPSKFDSGKNN